MKTLKDITVPVSIFFFVILCFLSIISYGQAKEVKVIEIRNYSIKQGQRDRYIDSFETLLVDTLNARGNYVLGQYTVKGEDDNFVWIRGFDDMPKRKEALQSFFSSNHWKKHQNIPGELLLGYTNVYLLKPLDILGETSGSDESFSTDWFGKQKGVAVVDFYIANEMRDKMIDFVRTDYDSLMRAAGVKHISYWVSEPSPNNYPSLPVFQDKNLLVTISFYKNEQEYLSVKKKIESSMNEESKFERARVITTSSTWILYPTKKSYTAEVR